MPENSKDNGHNKNLAMVARNEAESDEEDTLEAWMGDLKFVEAFAKFSRDYGSLLFMARDVAIRKYLAEKEEVGVSSEQSAAFMQGIKMFIDIFTNAEDEIETKLEEMQNNNKNKKKQDK